MKSENNHRMKISIKILLLFISIILIVYISIATYRTSVWKMYPWLPTYFKTLIHNRSKIPDHQKHIILVFVDHYEPGHGTASYLQSIQRSEDWLAKYRQIADRHQDSFGNKPRYTWFYAYDERNPEVLTGLNKMAYEGYGEVELHWHHPKSNNALFPGELREAVSWFQQYGALITCGLKPETHFAFTHGNWALDGTKNAKGHEVCGVTRELDILKKSGSYADFTFSTIGVSSQPTQKLNTLYYAKDNGQPKSYNNGTDVRVGKPIEDQLMIFLGPISINPITWKPEFAALERYALPNKQRVKKWINANIHVKGRPEWVFVKVYSHGIQSNIIINNYFDQLLTDIEQITTERGMKLHYMSAREAYNVVKAAEAGKTGNPEDYRDFKIAPYCNMRFHTETPVTILGMKDGKVHYVPKYETSATRTNKVVQ